MPTIKKIQISVPTDPQNPEEAKKIVQRAIDQDRLSGRNVFSGKGPIYVQTTTGLQGLNGIKKITGTSGNVIIREQTGISRVLRKILQSFLLIGTALSTNQKVQ